MRRVVSSIVAFALVGAVVPVEAHDGVSYRTDVGKWRIDVHQDGFTGVRTCSVRTRGRHLVATPLVLGVRPVGRRDMGDAWLRVDGGPAVAWRDMLPELARLGVQIDGRDMAAPTDGWIWIPRTALGGARTILIRWAPRKRVRHFDVTGVETALDAARAGGCSSEDFVS